MSSITITIDLDWACEPAIEETLDFLEEQGIVPTIFITHRSCRVENVLDRLEVGLHPFFDPTSSHGSTTEEVVKNIMELPHNIPAFRCHRFAISNEAKQAMAEAGMLFSSNVCTDLEVVPPFRERCGLLEVPIFLEDGGYLSQNHPLDVHEKLLKKGNKVILIHPMHFAINTPHFDYMRKIKSSLSRTQWRNLTQNDLKKLKWQRRGIRDLLAQLIETIPHIPLSTLLEIIPHNRHVPQLESGNQNVPIQDISQNLPLDTATDHLRRSSVPNSS